MSDDGSVSEIRNDNGRMASRRAGLVWLSEGRCTKIRIPFDISLPLLDQVHQVLDQPGFSADETTAVSVDVVCPVVFRGRWELRERYQGLAPPMPHSEDHFDAGTRGHIPTNVPYTRYVVSRILEFQFHAALCRLAGEQVPLHRCSIFFSKEAGRRLRR